MVTAPDVAGAVLSLVALPAVVLVWLGWRNWEKPGARGFTVNAVGWAFWALFVGLRSAVDSYGATVLMQNVALVFVNLTTLGWALLVAEYVRRRRIELTARRVVPFLVVPVVVCTLAFTNGAHYLVWGPGTDVTARGVLTIEFGPVYLLDVLYLTVLAEGAALFLVRDFVGSEGVHRRQTVALIAGHAVVFAFGADTFFKESLPFSFLDYSPIGLLIGGSVFAVALFRYDLLQLVPVARRTVVETMSDPVVAVDPTGTVVDANPALNRLFDREDPTGASIREVFAGQPALLDICEQAGGGEHSVTIQTQEGLRHFTLDVTPLGDEDVDTGRLFVFRDVTALKSHEQDLDVLKQVLTRVLRHNIRNDLTAIKAYAATLAEETDGRHRDLATRIVEASDDLVETSEKARHIEKVVDQNTAVVEVDLVTVLEGRLETLRADHPAVTVTLDAPESLPVSATPDIDTAVVNLVENACVHNDAADPEVRIEVTREDGWATVEITDNGPGIPREEIAVIDKAEETQLEHGSGVGLWLADMIVRESGGALAMENTGDGASVTVTLPLAGTDADFDSVTARSGQELSSTG